MKTTSWLSQFGAEYDVPAEISSKLKDISWGNDACPSFLISGPEDSYHGLTLWVEHPELGSREAFEYRFVVTHKQETVFETESLSAILEWIASCRLVAGAWLITTTSGGEVVLSDTFYGDTQTEALEFHLETLHRAFGIPADAVTTISPATL